MYNCKILLDSISETGKRITTFEITFPRCVLAEAETHRVFYGFDSNIEEIVYHNVGINVDKNLSRNSASSRAIPINKMIQRVKDDPFIPEKWGKPVAGMGAKEYWPLDSIEHLNLTMAWKFAMRNAIEQVEACISFGNKEELNRLLEPFMYHTTLITATEFDNFFKLRTNSAADWKIRRIADLMYEAYHAFDEIAIMPPFNSIKDEGWIATRPQNLKIGEWHCPLVYEEDDEQIAKQVAKELGSYNTSNENLATYIEIKKKISVARCARVSYLTHDGKRDIEKDLELFERLRTSGHWSPFEHVATPYWITDGTATGYRESLRVNNLQDSVSDTKGNLRSGNFIGWRQMRYEFPDQNCTFFRKGEN